MFEQVTQYLFSVITRLNKILRKQAAAEEENFGDAYMFGMLFSELKRQSGANRIRMTDLSQYLMVSKPAATQSVNRLVERGFLERTRDENDRRVVYIGVTSEGERQFETLLREKMQCVEGAIDRIGVEKADMLGKLLDEFIDALVAESEGK